MDNAHTGYWEDLERLEAKVETSSTSLEVRLQRWELVGTGGAYSEHRSMKRVEPYEGQEFDDSDEWCNAEEVFALEAKVERLAELARTRGNANDHFEKLKRQAERERDETLRELADAHAELADAQNRELFAKIEKRDETLRADGGE
tara:strand:- start:2541 stop:2978 length:438 start_codon:yes stop_codon:yes gene_type:complete